MTFSGRWVHAAATAALFAVPCAEALAACSSSNSATSGFSAGVPGGDDGGGSSSSGGTTDTGPPSDAPVIIEGGDAPAPPPPPTVTFVHASPSLSDTRLCWGKVAPVDAAAPEGGTPDQLTTDVPFPSGAPMPASNFPGLSIGGAVSLSPATALAAMGAVNLYAIDAKVLARTASAGVTAGMTPCNQLVCTPGTSSCLRPNEDYWPAGTIPAGAIAPSGPTVVALAGCLGSAQDPAAGAARCGAGWEPVNGNLHVEVLHVVSSPVAPGDSGVAALSVQAALLSPALAASLGDAGAAVVAFGASGDAGKVASLVREGEIEPTPSTIPFAGDLPSFGQVGFEVDAIGTDAASPTRLWMSLAQSMALIDPSADPRAFFGIAVTYVVAIVGDPSAPSPSSQGDAGSYDGRGLHVLVIASAP